MNRNILLVEPKFPIPTKSKNHKNFLPIGLLKIASFLRSKNINVLLVRGFSNSSDDISKLQEFNPTEIWITSLFTYWSKHVKDSVQYYKKSFPNAKIIVGGIYASLMPEHCKEYTGCHEVFKGIYKEAEDFFPAYDLVDVNYQIMHTSRGCIRKCKFCGTYRIEPRFYVKNSILDEIKSNKLIFYDNNFLANKNIFNILDELSNAKYQNKLVHSECQSGFDGRILNEALAIKLKKARFINPRIAWDNSYNDYKEIERQLVFLYNAGYNPKDIYVFMVYNFELSFEIMEDKRKKCYEWGVQISDCRYRPLDQIFDNYNSHVDKQTNKDYFIHPAWKDEEVRQFRANVRRQNICIRHNFPFYSKILEHHKYDTKLIKKIKDIPDTREKIKLLEKNNLDFWLPDANLSE